MYDVIIVGAGPAGATAALYAERNNLRCIVLDKAIFPRDKICGDALSGKSVRIMEELDLTSGVERLDGSEINRITFGGPNHRHFDVHLKGNKKNNFITKGYVVPRKTFDYFLFKKAKNVTEILEGFKVKDLIYDNDKIAGIGVVGGHMFIDTYNYCSPTHPTPIINIHGTDDFYDGISTYYLSQENSNNYWINYNKTNEVPIISQIENINVEDGSTVELYSWKNGDNGTTVEHYKIIGGGHNWPNINQISSGKEGYSNGDIDANTLIWNYLSNYDINGIR